MAARFLPPGLPTKNAGGPWAALLGSAQILTTIQTKLIGPDPEQGTRENQEKHL